MPGRGTTLPLGGARTTGGAWTVSFIPCLVPKGSDKERSSDGNGVARTDGGWDGRPDCGCDGCLETSLDEVAPPPVEWREHAEPTREVTWVIGLIIPFGGSAASTAGELLSTSEASCDGEV